MSRCPFLCGISRVTLHGLPRVLICFLFSVLIHPPFPLFSPPQPPPTPPFFYSCLVGLAGHNKTKQNKTNSAFFSTAMRLSRQPGKRTSRLRASCTKFTGRGCMLESRWISSSCRFVRSFHFSRLPLRFPLLMLKLKS
jgi:hypothetical protein